MKYEAEIAILMQDGKWNVDVVKFYCATINATTPVEIGEEIEKAALEKFRNNTDFIESLYNSGWNGCAIVYSWKQIKDDGGRVIKLPCYDIVVTLDSEVSDQITSSLHKNSTVMEEEDVQYQAAIDAIESIIMAHAVAGVDIETPAYLEGIETAVNAIGQNFPIPDED